MYKNTVDQTRRQGQKQMQCFLIVKCLTFWPSQIPKQKNACRHTRLKLQVRDKVNPKLNFMSQTQVLKKKVHGKPEATSSKTDALYQNSHNDILSNMIRDRF